MPLVKKMADSKRSYDALKSKYSTKEEKLLAVGPHHVQAWNALVSYMEEQSMEMKLTTKSEDGSTPVCPVKQYIATMTKEAQNRQLPMHRVVQHHVRYCRMMDTHQKKMARRLEVNFVENTASERFWRETAVEILLSHKEVRILPGIAPPGDMERRLQATLEELME
eukprot:TRINITY_DN20906_c0_g1_i3.p2 TRINITY_DN20906_c0_g1~~TRINITY_DN20906_c0_g1_i3.p2  ORF type:complete len:166 (+),score=24.47 TRINITY_DN20906_c0_g1_i3:296-793(+)